MVQNEYDRVPYESYSFWYTHISHLELMGKLFGMNTSDVHRCRVLELGGASGGNSIPMAAQYPQCEFVCIDQSAVQTEEGTRHAANLGLRNITFQTLSILDFEPSNGEFDYIICHGVFSWVKENVQDKILEIARNHLKPQGVALVSYNTLPGWSMARSVRDMMRYHSRGFADPAEKVRQSRELLRFIEDSQKNVNGPWAETIRTEVTQIAKSSDSYLLHEYLEENNEPCYFFQFMQRANRFGLQYLGDSKTNFMVLENQPRLVSQTLAALDTVQIEQYSDFIHNRRFRISLLCHQGQVLSRTIDTGWIDRLYLRTVLTPEDGVPPSAERPGKIFHEPDGLKYTTDNAMTTGILLTLTELAALPVTANTVVTEAATRYGLTDATAVRQNLRLNAVRLFFLGVMQMYAHPPAYVGRCSDKPIALPVARYQASFRQLVANGRHETVALNPLERIVLQLLDGTRTPQSLVAAAMAQLTKQSASLLRDGLPITDRAEMEREMAVQCDKALQSFATQALLVA